MTRPSRIIAALVVGAVLASCARSADRGTYTTSTRPYATAANPFHDLPAACAPGPGKGVVEGRVVDDSLGAPVHRLRVVTEPLGCPALAFEGGRYYFAGLAPGTYALVVPGAAPRDLSRYVQLAAPTVVVAAGDTLQVSVHVVPRPCRTEGPSGRLAGTVVNDSSGAGVGFAQVRIAGTECMALTDSLGSFTLFGAPADTVDLVMTRLGYAAVTLPSVAIAPAGVTRVEIRAHPARIELVPARTR